MTAAGKPCAACPWTSRAERDKAALTPEIKAAARAGQWFCCHVNMGTCHGAARYGSSGRAKAEEVAAELNDA